MGYYTELKLNIKLKKETPDNIIEFLKKVLIDKDIGVDNKFLFKSGDVFKPWFSHDFFKCQRWYMLFLSTNWDEDMQGGKLREDKGNWTVNLHTEFKNYDDEIDKFMDWITPYIVGRKKRQYVGQYQGENMDNPINIYIER